MKKLPILIASVVAALALFSTNLSAQESPTKVVYVNARALFEAHPEGQGLIELEQQMREELQGIASQIQPLNARVTAGQQLSAQERSNLELLQRTYQETQQRYQADLSEMEGPISEQINAVISAIAKENGYGIVLRGELLGEGGLGLVVYADPGLDITQQAVERIQAQ